jgi:hypothetical protein
MKYLDTTFIKKILAFSIVGLMLSACESESSFESSGKVNYILDLTGESLQINQHCLVMDENDPNNKFSRIDSVNVYGYGMMQRLPDSLKSCNLKLIISGKMRETESITGNIAISLVNPDNSIAYFGVINSDKYVTAANTWVVFKDSMNITSDRNSATVKDLKIFSGKGLGKGFFDVDDLTVQIIKE